MNEKLAHYYACESEWTISKKHCDSPDYLQLVRDMNESMKQIQAEYLSKEKESCEKAKNFCFSC